MTKICHCGGVIEYCIKGTDDDNRVTHGICQKCADAEKVKLKNLDELTHVDWPGWVKRKP